MELLLMVCTGVFLISFANFIDTTYKEMKKEDRILLSKNNR